MSAFLLYNGSILAAGAWKAWGSYREKVADYNKQTLSLVCDGVLFSNRYGPRPTPASALFIGENGDAGAVGHGTLFVTIKGGPPIRFAELTVADVEGLPEMLRTTQIEQGREIVSIGDRWVHYMSLDFDQDRLVSGSIKREMQGRLVHGRIQREMDEIVFCDSTGKKEFRLTDTFEHIKAMMGEGNYKERFPNSR